jgi:hypothetical protein
LLLLLSVLPQLLLLALLQQRCLVHSTMLLQLQLLLFRWSWWLCSEHSCESTL